MPGGSSDARWRHALTAVAFLVTSGVATARAEPGCALTEPTCRFDQSVPVDGSPTVPLPPPPPPEPVRVWYGWQGLVVDAVSVGVVIGGVYASSVALVTAGSSTYAFGAPIVHWAHGNVGRGFVSLGGRVGAPLGGFIVGAVCGAMFGPHQSGHVPGGGSSDDVRSAAAAGAITAGITASLLDAAFLAYTRRSRTANEAEASAFTVGPKVDLHPGRGTVGVGGTF